MWWCPRGFPGDSPLHVMSQSKQGYIRCGSNLRDWISGGLGNKMTATRFQPDYLCRASLGPRMTDLKRGNDENAGILFSYNTEAGLAQLMWWLTGHDHCPRRSESGAPEPLRLRRTTEAQATIVTKVSHDIVFVVEHLYLGLRKKTFLIYLSSRPGITRGPGYWVQFSFIVAIVSDSFVPVDSCCGHQWWHCMLFFPLLSEYAAICLLAMSLTQWPWTVD